VVVLALLTCLAATSAHAQTQAEKRALAMKVGAACMSDLRTYCKDVERGGGRIAACLKQNNEKLSKGCRDAFQEAVAQ
jgi:hypothetical protein